MDYRKATVEDIKKELGASENQLMQAKQDVQKVSKELGIKPDIAEIEAEIERVTQAKKEAEEKLESIVSSLEEIDASINQQKEDLNSSSLSNEEFD